MKLDYIDKNKELLSVIMIGISVLFAALIAMKIVSYYKLYTKVDKIEDITQTMLDNDCNNPDNLKKHLGPTKEIADNLKKFNLFAPPQPKNNPVTQVTGIMGDEAFINNKWYKEGEMVQDAKIVSIEPTQVTIEWDGKKTVLCPLGANVASDKPNESTPPAPEPVPTSSPKVVTIVETPQEEHPKESAPQEIVMIEQSVLQQIPDEMEQFIQEQMKIHNIDPAMIENLSDEEKAKMLEMIKMQMQRN